MGGKERGITRSLLKPRGLEEGSKRPGSSCLIRPLQRVSSSSRAQAYLLVVPNQNEVLASFAQCGNGVGLKDLCSLFHNDDPGLHLPVGSGGIWQHLE